MDTLISMGVAAVLDALLDKKRVITLAPKLAKLFVALERTAEHVPTLAGAIERARQKA